MECEQENDICRHRNKKRKTYYEYTVRLLKKNNFTLQEGWLTLKRNRIKKSKKKKKNNTQPHTMTQCEL